MWCFRCFSQLLLVVKLFSKGTCYLRCLHAGTGWTMTRRRRRFSRPRPIECKSKQEQSSRQVWRGWALFPQPARDDRAVVADVSIVEFMWRWADRQNLTISRKATTIRCGVVGDGGHYRLPGRSTADKSTTGPSPSGCPAVRIVMYRTKRSRRRRSSIGTTGILWAGRPTLYSVVGSASVFLLVRPEGFASASLREIH